jgi:hypothetical protein
MHPPSAGETIGQAAPASTPAPVEVVDTDALGRPTHVRITEIMSTTTTETSECRSVYMGARRRLISAMYFSTALLISA